MDIFTDILDGVDVHEHVLLKCELYVACRNSSLCQGQRNSTDVVPSIAYTGQI